MDPRSPRPAPHRRAAALASAAVIAVATLVLAVGWGFDVGQVRSVVPGAVGMTPRAATLLIFCACALLLLAPASATRGRRRAGQGLAGLSGLLAGLVLVDHLTGWHLSFGGLGIIDQEARGNDVAHLGQFAPTTGACFVLLAVALLTLDRGRLRRWRVSEVAALLVGLVASFSLVGYAYGIPVFYGPAAAAKMAVNTAACFVLLAAAVLLARPNGRLVELSTTADPGGVMVRRLLPLCVVGPLAAVWVSLRFVGGGLLTAPVAAWWLAAGLAFGAVVIVWSCAAAISGSDRDRRALEARLFELAHADQLTGVANRRSFVEQAGLALARSRRSGEHAALLAFDLDAFKGVNDRFGHRAGDQMLQAVATSVVARLRGTDVVGRLGGDEFAVLLPDTDASAAGRVADDLLGVIASSLVPCVGGAASTTASIGLVDVAPTGERDLAELLDRADLAMYAAKRAGGDRVVVEAGLPLHRDGVPRVLHRLELRA